jgi:dienelactone hydrolase
MGTRLRAELIAYLKLVPPSAPSALEVLERARCDGYDQLRIRYAGDEDDTISAFLLIPQGWGPFPAVLVHHQHHGERHLGKSEVCGLAGDPLHAFGPALARQGFVVLAPDSIAFEDRRTNRQGIEPDPDPDEDWLQHYNQMAYRLIRGDSLMRKVLSDALRGTALLAHDPRVDARRVGLLGHSYGGNTVLFQAAVDDRVAFACSSGAAASFRHKLAAGTGIEMAEVIPGFAQRWDLENLIAAASPSRMLIVSAEEDKYSRDAGDVVDRAKATYALDGVPDHLEHRRFPGGHEMTSDRFEAILQWFADRRER